MQSIVINWDGASVPAELRKLPPGRYFIEPADDLEELTSEEENGILGALKELDAGHGIPLVDVLQHIMSRANTDEREWLRAAALNPAFDFLAEPGEDIYTVQDGRPFHVQR